MPLTSKECKSYLNQANSHLPKKFEHKYTTNKNYRKFRDLCHYIDNS